MTVSCLERKGTYEVFDKNNGDSGRYRVEQTYKGIYGKRCDSGDYNAFREGGYKNADGAESRAE